MADLRVIKVGILTVSDTCYSGKAEDKSGGNLMTLVESGKCFNGTVTAKDIIHDVAKDIKAKLLHWSDRLKLDVILTTGGTGFSPRDVTPEATKEVIEKEALGMSVAMIKGSLDITPLAMLSRLVCGIRGNTLIINLPGSTKGSAECLQIVSGSIPHAVDLLRSNAVNVESTHSTLQAQGISSESTVRSAHSTGIEADNLSHEMSKTIKATFSSAPNLPKHLQNEESQNFTVMRDCVTKFCDKLKDFVEQLINGILLPNFNFIECHIGEGDQNNSNQWMNLMTKFMQVLVFVVDDFTQALGVSQQINSISPSSQIGKVMESKIKMKSWLQNCQQVQSDPAFMIPSRMPDNDEVPQGSFGRNGETNSTKSFIWEGDKRGSTYSFLYSQPVSHPSSQIESHSSKSSSYISNSKQLKTHSSSFFETDLYDKRAEGVSVTLGSDTFTSPNSYKMFHQVCGKSSKRSDSTRNEIYCGHSTLSKKTKSRNEFASNTEPVQADPLKVEDSKHTPDNFLLRESDVGYVHPSDCSLGARKKENISFLMNNVSRIPANVNSKEMFEVESLPNQCNRNDGISGKYAINQSNLPDKFGMKSQCHEKKSQYSQQKMNELRNNKPETMDTPTHSSDFVLKQYPTPVSAPASFSSESMLLSCSTNVMENDSVAKSPTKQQIISKSNPHLPGNIMSAKIHNVPNPGELVNVPVGKAFNCFVNDHRLLKGISLYKGKRDIKKLLVYMARQEDVSGQATSWKRGKEVLERNRFDDYFQLTCEGMEEQQHVRCGRKRDQYVVNWYMWCPGHGNCKRKCGGFGKCVQNCKGMLHKQDRHNCSLMVNLKLFLSDLTTWRVHITGNHLPEQSDTVTAVSTSQPSMLDEEQCRHSSSLKDKSFLTNGYNDEEQSVDNLPISLKDTPMTLTEANMEMVSSLPGISSNKNGTPDNEHDLLQSKIPSKKRISKMLSSLKRRRQNKPYGLIKSRPANSKSSCEFVNSASNMSFPKSFSQDFDPKQKTTAETANSTYPAKTPVTTLPATAPCNQNSLLKELSSYLPGGCVNDVGHHQANDNLAAESLGCTADLKQISSQVKISSTDNAATAYSCHSVPPPKYTLTEYITTPSDLPLNLDTTEEDVDIYHSAISLPNFHQPFLHANSLTEILTEAGVNISEQFDDLNSSINLGNDSSSSRIDHTTGSVNETFSSFQPAHQIPAHSSSSILSNDSSNTKVII